MVLGRLVAALIMAIFQGQCDKGKKIQTWFKTNRPTETKVKSYLRYLCLFGQCFEVGDLRFSCRIYTKRKWRNSSQKEMNHLPSIIFQRQTVSFSKLWWIYEPFTFRIIGPDPALKTNMTMVVLPSSCQLSGLYDYRWDIIKSIGIPSITGSFFVEVGFPKKDGLLLKGPLLGLQIQVFCWWNFRYITDLDRQWDPFRGGSTKTGSLIRVG